MRPVACLECLRATHQGLPIRQYAGQSGNICQRVGEPRARLHPAQWPAQQHSEQSRQLWAPIVLRSTSGEKPSSAPGQADFDPLALRSSPTQSADRSANPPSCPSQQGSPGQQPKESPQPQQEEDNSVPVRVALAMLAFYRSALSPLMQSTCRYQPTCSKYSIESYKKFGVWKGSVLTAWRLLRCNPWGSSGYDPPMWPPPGLALVYGPETWEYNPHVTVVVGAVLAAWIAQGLWAEVSAILHL